MDRLKKIKPMVVCQWREIISGLRSDDPMNIGKSASKLFLAFLVVLALVPYSSGGVGWELKFWTLIKSPPNEIGDTLAGIAGALAFLWIIVTVQLQSRELKAQREELELARGEYAKMAKAQEKQVEALDNQGKIFEKEQKQRDEDRARQLLDELVVGLARLVRSERSLKGNWHTSGSSGGGFSMPGQTVRIFGKTKAEQSDDELLSELGELIRKRNLYFVTLPDGKLSKAKSDNYTYYEEVFDRIEGICALKHRISDDQNARLENLNASQVSSEIEKLLKLDIWEDSLEIGDPQ